MGKGRWFEKEAGGEGAKSLGALAAHCARTAHALLPLFSQFTPILLHFKANYYCVSHSKALYCLIEVYNLVRNPHILRKHSFLCFCDSTAMAGATATRKRSEHPRHPPYKKIVQDALEQEVGLLLSRRGERILENCPSLRREAAA